MFNELDLNNLDDRLIIYDENPIIDVWSFLCFHLKSFIKNMIISIVGNFDETDVINKFSTLENKKISKD